VRNLTVAESSNVVTGAHLLNVGNTTSITFNGTFPFPQIFVDSGGELQSGVLVIQGGELDTSLLLYLAPELVRMDLAQDFALTPELLARYRPGQTRRLPVGSPGSVGYPSLATAQKGELLYRFLLDRISSCLAGT